MNALLGPAAEAGVPWTTTALDVVVDQADGYPYWLQLIGAATWDAARPQPGSALSLDHVRAGVAAVAEQVQAMYRARWDSASERERDFMAAMAIHPDPEMPGDHLATQMGLTSRAVSAVRDRLTSRGIIEAARHGYVRFTIPGFTGYVRDIVDPGTETTGPRNNPNPNPPSTAPRRPQPGSSPAPSGRSRRGPRL